MKLIFRILLIIYSIISGIILILLFPVLYPLGKLNLDPKWLYNGNDFVINWFNKNIWKK
jgi:hypothetical protein